MTNTVKRKRVTMTFVGDIHGDGFDDIVVGELYANTRLYHSGKVHMWVGSANGSTSAWFTKGTSSNALLGHNIAPAGDINEDGYDDESYDAGALSGDGNLDGESNIIDIVIFVEQILNN